MAGDYTKAAVSQRRAKRREALEAELKRVKEILSARADIVRGSVLGSFAKGNNREKSDLDIAVIQRTDKRFLNRIEELYQVILPRLDMDLLVYTPEEWEALRKDRHFVERIEKEGKTIYERSA